MNKLMTTCAAWLLAGFVVANAQAAEFTEGVHYFALTEPQPVQTGDKIEVLELFWYGCPHCYSLEPLIAEWRKNIPAGAEFLRMPGILRDSWELHARVYYTYEALGVLDKLHSETFDEIHKWGDPLSNLDRVLAFVQEHGVDKQQFVDAFNSFAVDSKVRHAKLMSQRYEAGGVPTMIVAGKYRATASSAGGYPELMQVITYLVEKAESEKR